LNNFIVERSKAVDIYVLVASVLPEGGLINKVTIYMSEFGHITGVVLVSQRYNKVL